MNDSNPTIRLFHDRQALKVDWICTGDGTSVHKQARGEVNVRNPEGLAMHLRLRLACCLH